MTAGSEARINGCIFEQNQQGCPPVNDSMHGPVDVFVAPFLHKTLRDSLLLGVGPTSDDQEQPPNRWRS